MSQLSLSGSILIKKNAYEAPAEALGAPRPCSCQNKYRQ